jgi:hypothetical protein
MQLPCPCACFTLKSIADFGISVQRCNEELSPKVGDGLIFQAAVAA